MARNPGYNPSKEEMQLYGEVIKPLLLKDPHFTHQRCDDGLLPIEKTIELGNYYLYDILIDHAYRKTIGPTEDISTILIQLLLTHQFKRFEEFMQITNTSVKDFFQTVVYIHFPFHYLCACNDFSSILYLVRTYSKEDLNIKAKNSKMLDFTTSKKINQEAWDLRACIKHDEQELSWSILIKLCNPLLKQSLVHSYKFELIKILLEFNCLSQHALIFPSLLSKPLSDCSILKSICYAATNSLSRPDCFALDYLYRYHSEKNNCLETIAKVERILKNENDNNNITVSLEYAMFYSLGFKNSLLVKKIIDLLDQDADYSSYSNILQRSPILQIIYKDNTYEILWHLYQVKMIPTNKYYETDFKGSNCTLLDNIISTICCDIDISITKCKYISSLITMIYAGGERLNYCLKIDGRVLKKHVKNINDDWILDKVKYAFAICPYRGPGSNCIFDNYISDLFSSYSYIPSLSEICRKKICDYLLFQNKNANLYKLIREFPFYSRRGFKERILSYIMFQQKI